MLDVDLRSCAGFRAEEWLLFLTADVAAGQQQRGSVAWQLPVRWCRDAEAERLTVHVRNVAPSFREFDPSAFLLKGSEVGAPVLQVCCIIVPAPPTSQQAKAKGTLNSRSRVLMGQSHSLKDILDSGHHNILQVQSSPPANFENIWSRALSWFRKSSDYR